MENKVDLPDEITISRPSIEDIDEMDEYVSNYLSDNYGFCVKSFNYDFDMKELYIYDIEWDTSE